jgi:hypothetical protein
MPAGAVAGAGRRGRSIASDDGIDGGGVAGRCTTDRGTAASVDNAPVRPLERRRDGRCPEQRREGQ